MHDSYNIGFVGAGNLAWHLAPALENSGHRISLVHNRSRKNAYRLMERLYRAEIKKNLNFSNDSLDLIVIAVNDNAIREVVSEIVLPESCQLVHTSGCQPLEILEKSAAANMGVFYPLQTFSKNVRLNLRETPFFLESSSEEGMQQLKHLARGLSKYYYQIDSLQRRTLHLSAVISTNFANHLFAIAKKLMEEKDLDFKLLHPITQTMVHNIFSLGPEAGQTGPAVRGDLETMDLHMALMGKREDLLEIYSVISKHIFETSKKVKRH
jgi:predicted short-subunit dehydrogenase-like oxidoreductase (DUF2520 family)